VGVAVRVAGDGVGETVDIAVEEAEDVADGVAPTESVAVGVGAITHVPSASPHRTQ
jgi:hypothetical protein